MKSVASGYPGNLVLPLLGVLMPAGVLAGEAHSSLEVSAQVVPGYSPAAAASLNAHIERIETAGSRDTTSAVVAGEAECKAIGNMAIVNGVWTSCSWEPDSQMYLVTVQY